MTALPDVLAVATYPTLLGLTYDLAHQLSQEGLLAILWDHNQTVCLANYLLEASSGKGSVLPVVQYCG